MEPNQSAVRPYWTYSTSRGQNPLPSTAQENLSDVARTNSHEAQSDSDFFKPSSPTDYEAVATFPVDRIGTGGSVN